MARPPGLWRGPSPGRLAALAGSAGRNQTATDALLPCPLPGEVAPGQGRGLPHSPPSTSFQQFCVPQWWEPSCPRSQRASHSRARPRIQTPPNLLASHLPCLGGAGLRKPRGAAGSRARSLWGFGTRSALVLVPGGWDFWCSSFPEMTEAHPQGIFLL